MNHTGKANNISDIINLATTAAGLSETDFQPICIISNGEDLVLVHFDYVDEYKADGYWVCSIFERGHIVEA